MGGGNLCGLITGGFVHANVTALACAADSSRLHKFGRSTKIHGTGAGTRKAVIQKIRLDLGHTNYKKVMMVTRVTFIVPTK